MLDEITFILDREVGELTHPCLALLILNQLEKFGMLPPFNLTLRDENNITYETHQDYCYWESEDE